LPIYVSEQVMQTAKLNTTGPPEGPTAEQLRGWLEGLNDEDLGRYKMSAWQQGNARGTPDC